MPMKADLRSPLIVLPFRASRRHVLRQSRLLRKSQRARTVFARADEAPTLHGCCVKAEKTTTHQKLRLLLARCRVVPQRSIEALRASLLATAHLAIAIRACDTLLPAQ